MNPLDLSKVDGLRIAGESVELLVDEYLILHFGREEGHSLQIELHVLACGR